MTKYVTRKYADDVSIKLLIDQREIKDKVFENIFSKFAKGQKLEIYDEKRELDDMEKREKLQSSIIKEAGINKHQLKKIRKEEQLKQINQL